MKKMLLHSCCAPCSTHVIDLLSKDYDLTIFYYNPNILPEIEYLHRKAEQIRFIDLYSKEYSVKINYIECEYTPEIFYSIASGLENEKEGGLRCVRCIEHRLEVTAHTAKKGEFDLFCTTLSVSPHKNAEKINDTGKLLSEKYGIDYLESNFKKKEGYKHSIELSKKYELYRQNYCGCGLPDSFYYDLNKEKN